MTAVALGALAAISLMSAVHLERDRELTVLMYHRVVPDSSSPARYRVTARDLESHIKGLRAEGHNILSTRGLSSFVSEGKVLQPNPVIITFDDGTVGHYQHAYPVLQRLDVGGIFFVVSDWVNDPGMMTFTQLREMQQNGMMIGSHSHTHPYAPSLRELPDSVVERELRRSWDILGDSLKSPPKVFSVPGGWYDNRTLRWADSVGYRWVFTSDIGMNDLPPGDMSLRRLEVAGDMNFDELLSPIRIVVGRTVQRAKKLGYSIVGPRTYRKLGNYNIYTVFVALSVAGFLTAGLLWIIVLRNDTSTD